MSKHGQKSNRGLIFSNLRSILRRTGCAGDAWLTSILAQSSLDYIPASLAQQVIPGTSCEDKNHNRGWLRNIESHT